MKQITMWTAVVVLLIAGSNMVCAQQKSDDSIWVAVRLYDGGGKSSFTEYYGNMQKAEFEGIITHSKTNGFFKLDSTCWLDDFGKLVRMCDLDTNQIKRGYSNTVFFRIEGITRIVLIERAFIEEKLLILDKKQQ